METFLPPLVWRAFGGVGWACCSAFPKVGTDLEVWVFSHNSPSYQKQLDQIFNICFHSFKFFHHLSHVFKHTIHFLPHFELSNIDKVNQSHNGN